MEEIDELAFLFAVKACAYDSMPLQVLRVQRYFLCFLGRLERALNLRLLGGGLHVWLLACQCHHPVKEPLLGCNHEGLGQPATICGASD